MDHKKFAKIMSSYTVLYIEDNANVRNQINEFLRRYCKTVYSCESAEEGLSFYKKHRPNIILLDINLPGVSGIEFATHIRRNDSKTRIVMLTSHTDDEFMIKAVELALTRYLVKPATSEDLSNALTKCVNELTKNVIVSLGNGKTYNKQTLSIISDEKTVPLRKKEIEILEYFLSREGMVVRYEELEEDLWKDEAITRDAIRSQIRNIRQKLGDDYIRNIANVGYKFNVPL